MYKPYGNELNRREDMITSFSGFNKNIKIPENAFNDECNITGDFAPVFSPRNKRALFNVVGERLHGLFNKSSLVYINNGLLYYGGVAVSGLSFPDIEIKRQFVSLGAKLLIFPDKVYLNTKNLNDYGSLEAEFTTASGCSVMFSLCRQDGTLYEVYAASATPPENPKNNDLWLDTSVTPNELKQYSEYSEEFIIIGSTYIRISYPDISEAFNIYDGIIISGAENDVFNGSFTVWDKGKDYLVIEGVLSEALTQNTPLKIERKVPDMDFFCENGNRVWGCSSKTNEIFASKLGDATNWYGFMGIANDSYAVTVGTDGEFTGAVSYKGYCLFFKENCVHKIYGSNPPFSVTTNYIRGVEKGSEKSLVTVNETLYYKSQNGICMYDGGLPINISENFGTDYYKDAVAGNLRDKYYICMTDKDNNRILFCYDEAKGVWHKEDEIDVKEFCCHNTNLYFIAEKNGERRLYLADSYNKHGDFFGELSGYSIEDDFPWFFETGIWGLDLPQNKYYSNINIRLFGDEKAELIVYFQYDSCGNWEKVGEYKLKMKGTLNLPFLTKRCDHLRMKIAGIGNVKILSISRMLEGSSEL